MSNNKHAPGLLTTMDEFQGQKYIGSFIGRRLASGECDTSGPVMVRTVATENAKANAERLVACWNACAGIDPAAVPELVEACKDARDLLLDFQDALTGGRLTAQSVHLGLRKRHRTAARDFAARCNAAILKATGGGE
jgi:hypothetical protein